MAICPQKISEVFIGLWFMANATMPVISMIRLSIRRTYQYGSAPLEKYHEEIFFKAFKAESFLIIKIDGVISICKDTQKICKGHKKRIFSGL